MKTQCMRHQRHQRLNVIHVCLCHVSHAGTWPVCFCHAMSTVCHNKITSKTVGGGPRVVVSTAAFHARVRGSVPGLGGLKETKNVSSPSTCESQYCGEPP